MAKIVLRPRNWAKCSKETPEVWECNVLMREDGTFEMSVKGETGLEMLTACLDALRRIDRLRAETSFDFRTEGVADLMNELKIQERFSERL
jgi:hypothetical protein